MSWLTGLMTGTENSEYYDPGFRAVLEDHMTTLRAESGVTWIDIDPHLANKYSGDFYGLLSRLNVDYHLHWLVMRFQDFVSPDEADGTLTRVWLPATDTVTHLLALYKQTKSTTA